MQEILLKIRYFERGLSKSIKKINSIFLNPVPFNGFQNKIRLRHMRRAIARARLCTRLKRQRRAKKSTPCLIKKASRCAADRTSKTCFIFHFLYNTQRFYEKIICICYLIGSVVIIFTFSLHKGWQTSND